MKKRTTALPTGSVPVGKIPVPAIIQGSCDASLKRLEQGTFEFPKVIGEAAGVSITATELSLILGGVALNAKRRLRYAKPEKSLAQREIPAHV